MEEACRREVREETSIELRELTLVGVYSDVNRDPRGHIVSVAYATQLPSVALPRAGSDATSAEWLDTREVTLGFDHARILADAKAKIFYTSDWKRTMPKLTTKDGTKIYFKDWGEGQPVVFSHGWPLSSDAFEDQMFYLASRGYRCIAHDRRGHGRSSQPWNGNDMDTYADDLAALVKALGLKNAIHVGHSTGGAEIARYIGRHGTKRVAKTILIGSVTPLMVKTDANPAGTPIKAFDDLRAAVLADRSQLFKDLSVPFYGYNRSGAKASEGVRQSFWLQGMLAGMPASYFCIEAFSETDFTEDLKAFDVPTLILHGDDDQIVPIQASGMLSAKIVKHAQFEVYKGGSHGMCTTEKEKVNADLLAFIQS